MLVVVWVEIERQVRRLSRTLRRLSIGAFGRLIKSTIAATSRLAILGVIIGIPAAALGGFISLIKVTIRSLSEFEQRILGLQAILASSVVFLEDPVENFRNAGLVAIGVIEKLSLRANEMVTSLSEATIVFQTLLATGAQRLVTDVDKLVDLTILLSNSIAGITTGQDRQRQLAEETRSLFTGQLRSTSLLARLIFKNRQEMLEFFRAAEASDTVVEALAEKLKGFSLIARDLARTLEGLKTTFVTLLQVIARRAFAGLLAGLEARVGDIFDKIQSDVTGLNLLAASLAAAVKVSVAAIGDIIERVFGVTLSNTENLLQGVTNAIPGYYGVLPSCPFHY